MCPNQASKQVHPKSRLKDAESNLPEIKLHFMISGIMVFRLMRLKAQLREDLNKECWPKPNTAFHGGGVTNVTSK